MTIEVYPAKRTADSDRLFTAYCSHPDTPRGEYDELIDLVAHDAHGYVPRDELRRAACRELKRRHQANFTVRRVSRTA